MENLEPTKESVEQAKQPSMEKAKQVSPKPEKVSTPTTFTQEDIDQRLKKEEKEWQSRKDKEFTPLKTQIAELQRQVDEAKLAALEKSELDHWGDTDEVKDFQVERRKMRTDRIAFEREKMTQEADAKVVFEEAKAIKAHKLATENGIDEKALLKAETPEQMEVLALKLTNEKLASELEKAQKPPRKIDSGVPSGTGRNLDEMSSRELIKLGVTQRKK